MINKLMNKYGVLKTTVLLSVLSIIVSESIAAICWLLAGLPNLGFLLIVAFICPAIIAPVVIISLCRLTESSRKSEEKYRSLFENSSDLIQVVQPDGQILYVNPSWCKAMGYTIEEANSLNIFDIVHPESEDQCKSHFGRTITEGTSGVIEPVFQNKEGGKVIVNGSANTKYNKHGQPSFIHCIFQNVTERRHLEDELIKMQKLESVGVLAGGIAHDFNNILTAILGNLSLARTQSEKPGSNSFKRIEEAEKATISAISLTQQLLTFSKGGEPIKDTTSIKELIEDSCQFILRGSNVKCVLDLSEALSLVEVDKSQISQVIHNLLINADQAMPDGGTVNVQANNVRKTFKDKLPLKDGSYVLVSIEDQGVGISEKDLSKIFDPFFSTKHEGHGLGLATAYSIIKKHGGFLTADSNLGKGAVFRFYLPVSTKTGASQTPTMEDIQYGEGSILVMDDEESVREIAREMLSYLGYKVVTTADGEQAIEMYSKALNEKTPFDVVILDITVPGGMGGKETIKKLIKIDPSIKAIVSSGYSNDPIMSNYKHHGFSSMMAKPYRMADVSKIIQNLLDSN